MTSTYGQALKSSALIGGAQILSMALGIVRTKVVAVVLGPSGVGLFGLFGSIVDFASSIAGMGVSSSGIRQVAEAAASGDSRRLGRAAQAVRRTVIPLAVAGLTAVVVLAGPISRFTFGSDEHGISVAVIGLAVLFRLLYDSRIAVIQGLRRIGDLAKTNIIGAAVGTALTVPLVVLWKEEGVAAALAVSTAAMFAAASYFYARVDLPRNAASASERRQEALALLKLGSAFMASAVMTMGVSFAIRMLTTRELGIDAAGLYQCAWALAGLYVGLILQAMGADFYPRLTAVANDHHACTRMVNEQALVSVLLAAPGVVATIAFAPVVISIFYSHAFDGAVPVLRWLCLGVALRLVSWPLGYVLIAKGDQKRFFYSELGWTIVHLTLAWIGLRSYGVVGAALAFVGAYAFQSVINFRFARSLVGFAWSSTNLRVFGAAFAVILVTFAAVTVLPEWSATVVGVVLTIATTYACTRTLLGLVPHDRIPRPVLTWLRRTRLAA
jgi:PST family polysaccharide transporter